MAKKLKQSHFSFYLQNRPLKFCPEVHVPHSLKNCSGNRGPRAKIPKGAKGFSPCNDSHSPVNNRSPRCPGYSSTSSYNRQCPGSSIHAGWSLRTSDFSKNRAALKHSQNPQNQLSDIQEVLDWYNNYNRTQNIHTK